MQKLAVSRIEDKKNDTLLQAVLSYKEIKAKIAFLESELRPYKQTIEDIAAKTEDGIIITEDFKVTLTLAERESFNLKLAKAKLGDKVLKPFMSKTSFTTLRVS